MISFASLLIKLFLCPGIVNLMILLVIIPLVRYRNQEFLLTDSVFRYDGYSQLDDD